MKPSIVLLTSLALFLLMPTYFSDLYAQPTWSFSAEFLPSELYPGEWGTVKINLTNTDCSATLDKAVFKLSRVTEREIAEIKRRADEMKRLGKIEGYEEKYVRSYSDQGLLRYDVEFTVYGACKGKAIKVISVLLWFPWKKYPGRDLGTAVDVNKMLQAYNPTDYILYGKDPESSTILAFKIFIPPDILPKELDLRPHIDIRVDHPGWRPYTLEMYPITGPFQIRPYRTFNLTVTDYDGANPLAGAKLVIRRLIHYYDVREYEVPENGAVKISRLEEDNYEVVVYWNSNLYNQERPVVYAGILSTYDLASAGKLRTEVFNVRLSLLDLRGRPLDGARILLDGVEEFSENGVAVYPMVPGGNHSLRIFWAGVLVLDEWVWMGYHPTISPEISPPSIELSLPIGDLVVQAVDTGGNRVGASFTAKRLDGAIPEIKVYSETGLLNITQLPPGRYWISAINCSSVFGRCAEAGGIYESGAVSKLELPVHSASFKIFSSDKVLIPNATVILGPVSLRSGEDGSALFAGIPGGTYALRVLWKDIAVYEGAVEVSRSLHEDLVVEVYDLDLKFRTMDDRPLKVLVRVVDPSGEIHEFISPTDSVRLTLVPRGKCNLTIYSSDNITIFSKAISVEKLHPMNVLKLPLKDMLVRVVWEGGAPVSSAEVVLSRFDGPILREITDQRGEAIFRDMPLSNYSLRVNYPRTSIPMWSGNVTHSGDLVEIALRRSRVSIKVVDWFGNPLPGAEVSLTSHKIQLSSEKTGDDGVAVFPSLPTFPAYEVKVRYGGVEKWVVAPPDRALVVEMDVIRMGTLTIDISAVATWMPYVLIIVVAVAALAAIAYKLLIKRRGMEQEKEM